MFQKQALPQCCEGCTRILTEINQCGVYADPVKLIWARLGKYCPFNPPKIEDKKKKFVNPIKRSKRGGK